MASKVQYIPQPRSQTSQTAEMLRRMSKDMAEQRRQDRFGVSAKSSPSVKDNNVTQKKPRKKPQRNPLGHLTRLVNEHNAYIDLNDLNDSKYDVNDYYDPNSPSYLDQNDTEGIKEEQNYLQNRLYKLKGDERYVPDYEDMKQMNDEEYMNFIGDIGMVQDPNSRKVNELFDNGQTDDQFMNDLNKRMRQ